MVHLRLLGSLLTNLFGRWPTVDEVVLKYLQLPEEGVQNVDDMTIGDILDAKLAEAKAQLAAKELAKAKHDLQVAQANAASASSSLHAMDGTLLD